MHRKLLPLVGLLLASCGLNFDQYNVAYLVFDHKAKPLSYNEDRLPASERFDVNFTETARVRPITDIKTLVPQNFVLTDVQTGKQLPLKVEVDAYVSDSDGKTYINRVTLKSEQVLGYDRQYRLVARKDIKTRDGYGMARDEVLDFRTEKSPYRLAFSAAGVGTSKGVPVYNVKIHNQEQLTVPNTIVAAKCNGGTYSFHAFLPSLTAGASLDLQLQMDSSIPAEQETIKDCVLAAYDHAAERAILLEALK